METFSRQYETASGLVEVIITYDRTYTLYFLDFDVVEDIELSYGYEDEDQLTFYPNVVRVVFDDFKKQNYDVLKLSVGAYNNTLPQNKMQFGGLEIKLNGARKFKGYIDELSIEYDEEKLQTSFEALCLSHQLKNMNVDRDKIINLSGNRFPDNMPITVRFALYGVYKQLWTDFSGNVYFSSSINQNTTGFFIKHDWKFYGNDVISTCEGQRNLFNGMSGDPWGIPDLGNPSHWLSDGGVNYDTAIYFNFDSTEIFGQNRPCKTWADYIKLLALQLGATIGVMDYGKVYFIKRFGEYNVNFLDVSDKVIDDNFTKIIHLPVLRGVVIKNHWNGERTYEYGEIEKTPNGDYKYEDKVKSIDTYIGSYIQGGSRGTSIYTALAYPPCEAYYLIGCWNVKDPQLNTDGQMFELLGKWQRDNRVVTKEKVECILEGINYDMVTTYRITPPNTNNLAVNFRAMTMRKSLLKNQTDISGVET